MGNAVLNKSTQWILVGLIALMLVGSFTWMASEDVIIPEQVPVDYDKIGLMVATAVSGLNVPTAEEISAGIVVPGAADVDNQRLSEVWDSVYSDEVDTLEAAAEAVCIEEFLDDNEDFAKDGDEFGEDDKVAELFEEDSVVEFSKEYGYESEEDNDREITITNLGLDDEDGESGDDRAVTITSAIRVDVTPDIDEEFRDRVYLSCDVTSDDGELEADITYSLEA